MEFDRERLRTTFDSVAGHYQQTRPEYPDALYDELVSLAGLRPGARLLEVGCATGKATLPLARRGFAITCIELGPELAAVARHNLRHFPAVKVVNANFETWQPPNGETFDLVYAATAWHWVDPASRYRLAWKLLSPGGHLAVWNASFVYPDDTDPMIWEIERVFDEVVGPVPDGTTWPRPGELSAFHDEFADSGLFGEVTVRHFDWEASYDADEFVRLYGTFSRTIAMDPALRDRIDTGIRACLATRPSGRVRRHWGSALRMAPAVPAQQTN